MCAQATLRSENTALAPLTRVPFLCDYRDFWVEASAVVNYAGVNNSTSGTLWQY